MIKISRNIALIFSVILLVSSTSIIHPGVGEVAPPISLINPNGDRVELAKLKGKIVLIDFWASWCRTCRKENKTFSEAYNTYKNQEFKQGNGFEIYSVSLDIDTTRWKRAIENDGLIWTSHGCDFKKWDSPVVHAYNFKYLPHNLIIDGEGKVIAKELYGNRLIEFLEAQKIP